MSVGAGAGWHGIGFGSTLLSREMSAVPDIRARDFSKSILLSSVNTSFPLRFNSTQYALLLYPIKSENC